MLRTIYLPKSQNFKKMVGLKVNGNLKKIQDWILKSNNNNLLRYFHKKCMALPNYT